MARRKSTSQSGPVKTGKNPLNVSLLEELISFVEESSPLQISFEDLTGVRGDVEDMALPYRFCIHTCEFCMFAKSTRVTHQDCIANKLAVNRISSRRMEGFSGQCHLGLTDIVEPLIYKEKVMGVFYYGSVVVRGTEVAARGRICKYCAKRNINPAPFLTLLKDVPRIEKTDVPKFQARLRLLAKVCACIIEACGLPLDRYRTGRDSFNVHNTKMSALAKATMRYVHLNYAREIHLADVAAHVKCHPDYLCKVLRKQFNCGLGAYVNRVRIDHARHLILSRRFSLGEIAFQTGFNDQSYFTKIFKSLVGCTPGEYADQGDNAARPFVESTDRLPLGTSLG